MAVFPITSFLLVLSLCLSILHALPTSGSTTLGFWGELIHRDSPQSPLYDPTSTPFSRIRAVVHRRSAALANYLHNVHASAKYSNSRLFTSIDRESIYLDGNGYDGTYLTTLGLGTPMQTVYVGVSTAGHFSWVLCNPCKSCGKIHAQLFNPNTSTTYNTIPCGSNSCESIRRFTCGFSENRICKYNKTYGRYITVSGSLSNETLHFQNAYERITVPRIILGCTHEIKTRPDDGRIAKNKLAIGYMGLSDDKLSLINQLHYATDGTIRRKFSYCLPLQLLLQNHQPSRMYFGDTPPSKQVSHTTKLFISQYARLYYLHLKDIEVIFPDTTPEHIVVKQKDSHEIDGNILIDSAMPITFIKNEYMKEVRRNILKGMPRKIVSVPEGLDPVIKTCFDWSEPNMTVLPTIDLTFENDAIISAMDLFVEVKKGVLCFLMASADFTAGVQVLGSGAQAGHRLELDLENRRMKITFDFCEARKSK